MSQRNGSINSGSWRIVNPTMMFLGISITQETIKTFKFGYQSCSMQDNNVQCGKSLGIFRKAA